MSDILLEPDSNISVDTADDEERNINTPVSVSSQLVANGQVLRNGRYFARMTLVLRPTTEQLKTESEQGSNNTTVNLRSWPSAMLERFFWESGEGGMKTTIRVASAAGLSGAKKNPQGLNELAERASLIDAQLTWNSDRSTIDRIDRFWRRTMNPHPRTQENRKFWDQMVKALACQEVVNPSVLLPTPYNAAALAFTLDRGRMVLDSLAQPNSPLTKQQVEPRSFNFARPWYQGERLTKVASLDPTFVASVSRNSPEDEEYWVSPYRKRTAALLAGQAAAPIWPNAQTLAKLVINGGPEVPNLIERIFAAHHLTTPANPAYPICASEDDALNIARRRIGALMNLPTLQRLFGFAFDLLIDDESLRSAIGEIPNDKPFILISPEDDGANWTIARHELGDDGQRLFCPATWAELQGQTTTSSFGLRDLSAKDSSGNPSYDIITVEPVLATEASINHAARGEAKGSALSPVQGGVPVLHNGGLRVIGLSEEYSAAPTTTEVDCSPRQIIQDADDLRSGDRLMVGVQTMTGLSWRSPDYRVIRFEDPSTDAPTDWVEKELARRLDEDGMIKRLELDGSMAVQAPQILADSVLDTTPESSLEKNPIATKATKIITDTTLALWGSEPAGVPPPSVGDDGKLTTQWSVNVIEELDVTRYFAAPSSLAGHPSEHLSPALRFGWPYHIVLASVFAGGACADPSQINALVKRKSTVALPPVGQYGRRFLRHERLNAPMSLILESDERTLSQMQPPQRSGDMYVRTMLDAKLSVTSSRRLVVPPPVPFQFAMIHDVLRGLGSKRQGLMGLALLGKSGDQLPSRVRVGEQATDVQLDSLYYPDPAASILVLGLKLPQESDVEQAQFVEEPIAIPVGARTWPDDDAKPGTRRWPDVLPVHIEIKAIDSVTARDSEEKYPRLVSIGPRWLGRGEKLLAKSATGAVQVHAVEIHLRRGEDLLLQIWCVPTVNQLASWFDAIEAAGVLAMNDSSPQADADSACVRGLERLLDRQFPTLPFPDKTLAAKAACVGAGGLRAPTRNSLMAIAGLVYRELSLRPNAALASALTVRVTHAIDDRLLPNPELGPTLAVTRRVFAGGLGTAISRQSAPASYTALANSADHKETVLDFLSANPISDWGLNSTQEGASGALFGGLIRFDPASTSGLRIEAHCAAPFGEAFDPETGRTLQAKLENDWKIHGTQDQIDPTSTKPFGFVVDKDRNVEFERKNVVVLTLDGLPLPADGRAGYRSFRLEELMLAAWGAQRQFGNALRSALPATLNGGAARRLWLRAVPINRHSGLLPRMDNSKNTTEWKPSEPEHLWLPATTRPSPPNIDHVSVALSLQTLSPIKGLDGTFTVGVEQSCVLRIWHARPFFSSGEGEMVALVLWPPGLFAQGTANDENGEQLFPAEEGEEPEFFDADLGPGGDYITRWGADPLTGDEVPANKFPTGPLVNPARLPFDGIRVPRAIMPIPLADSSWLDREKSVEQQEDGRAEGTRDATPSAFLSVALQAFVPQFDPVEELWYVDISLRTDPLPFPRVRLGLVRYQPNAREDAIPPEGEEPVRLRVSVPVTEWVKPLPGRRATATCRVRGDRRTEIVVVVSGPNALPEATDSARPNMVVEVIRHKSANGLLQEEVMEDLDGQPAHCSSWSTDPFDSTAPGIMVQVSAGLSWTCRFVLQGPLEDKEWSYSIVVCESRELNSAHDQTTTTTGPIFIARIPLTTKAIKSLKAPSLSERARSFFGAEHSLGKSRTSTPIDAPGEFRLWSKVLK